MPNRLIINIRGPNGSGKTTLARCFLAHQEGVLDHTYQTAEGRARNWPETACRVPGLQLPVWVQGRYEGVQQGGCDTEKDMDLIEAQVRRAMEQREGHVLFEGMVVSKSGGRWLDFANRAQRDHGCLFVWAFLEPPVDELVRRIMERNGGKEPNRELLANTCRTVYLIRNKAKVVAKWGCLIQLDWREPPETTFSTLLTRLSELEVL